MAKPKPGSGVQNRPLYSRASFLYQAASYLAVAQTEPGASTDVTKTQMIGSTAVQQRSEGQSGQAIEVQGVSRRLLTDLREVTLKTMMRMTPGMKRTVCKFCDTLLIEGETCSSSIENKSKGGRKSWADVLVLKCNTCTREKRFPVQALRQKRRPARIEPRNAEELT